MVNEHIHSGAPVLAAGAPLRQARLALVLLHGRGGSAEDILRVGPLLRAEGVAFLAPQARGNTWYPLSFLSPRERNEPALSSALRRVGKIVSELGDAGLPPERIVLAGFSQGACLALEYAVRDPKRLGGLLAWSGGLIGPPGSNWPTAANLDGMPVFLGCSDQDPHIPRERVAESAAVFAAMGASVTERIYPAMGHTINDDEIGFAQQLLRSLADNA
jgi:predicted esterase